MNIENENLDRIDELNATAVVGLGFLTPYLFVLDAQIDNEQRPRIALDSTGEKYYTVSLIIGVQILRIPDRSRYP